jgi:hypothetical protein
MASSLAKEAVNYQNLGFQLQLKLLVIQKRKNPQLKLAGLGSTVPGAAETGHQKAAL